MSATFLAAAPSSCSSAAVGQAAKVKVWHQHTPAHYDKAQFKQAVVSSEGALRLSRQLKPLAGLDATHVWDVVEDKDGNLFVATGDEGKIYKVTPDGKVSRRSTTARTARSFAWPWRPTARSTPAPGPSGQIVRIDAARPGQGASARPAESYVWSPGRRPARRRRSTPAPGPRAASTRSTPTARPASSTPPSRNTSCAWRWGRRHALRRHRQGRPGLSHRCQGQGLRALPGAPGRGPQPAGDADGRLCRHQLADRNGTAAPCSSSAAADAVRGGACRPRPASAGEQASPTKTRRTRPRGKQLVVEHVARTTTTKSSAAPAPSTPAGSARIRSTASPPTARVREVFREKALVLSLLRQDGRFFVGTGMDGQLFEVDEATKERSEIARLDHGQIHVPVPAAATARSSLGTGDPGKLYVLQDRYAAKGTVTLGGARRQAHQQVGLAALEGRHAGGHAA